jgi:hypothetical protein
VAASTRCVRDRIRDPRSPTGSGHGISVAAHAKIIARYLKYLNYFSGDDFQATYCMKYRPHEANKDISYHPATIVTNPKPPAILSNVVAYSSDLVVVTLAI